MRQLNQNDFEWVLRKLPKDLKYHLENTTAGLVIAGGFIRAAIANEKINDIDIFTASKDQATEFANLLVQKNNCYESENAYSFTVQGRSVQVIHRWTFNTPEEIMAHFDFSIVQAAIWYDNKAWHNICSDSFYEDLAARRLVYTYPDEANAEPGASLLRILKYKARGYNPTLGTLAAVTARMARVEEKFILGELQEVDPLALPPVAAVESAPEVPDLGEYAG